MSGVLVSLGPEICRDLDEAQRREWLETNGLGGFACSTVAGLNTRRYHGLLTAALHPPAGRVVMVSKLEESLLVGDERFELSANEYPGAVHPNGYQYLRSFRMDPFPTFLWQVGGLELEKRLFLVHGEDTLVVQYELRGGDAMLELRPLIAFRDYHSLTRANEAIRREVELDTPGVASIAPYDGLPRLYFAHDGEAESTGNWYFYFQYAAERERGLDSEEDLFQPLMLRFDLTAKRSASVVISTKPARRAGQAPELRAAEEHRRARLVAGADDDFERRLRNAAAQFIVRRGEGHSVIAGYPWFTDWGRDTMIALPGLTIAAGRPEIARDVLAEFAANVSQGMLPNRFPDAGETPEYNTVDATLWFFEAVRAYLDATGDEEFVRGLMPKLAEIVDWHRRGTRYGIVATADGLLCCGVPGAQLTWMDAKIGDWVVTPRSGCPVEVQALWYNALRIAADFGRRFGDPDLAATASATADLAKESFNAAFWSDEMGYLADVVEGSQKDWSLRPNQIFAASLPHIMLEPDRARRVVQVVKEHLLTPLGLRTLSEDDPAYRPRYEGGVWQRDSAYHQGTVWPWLIGPFVAAWLRTDGDIAIARQCVAAFRDHMNDAGLGQISEIADAAPPHRPRGCFAQAWSVAEALEALQAVRARDREPVIA
ncbi:MAG: amylo-alpha-1,6-glucosidase [Bryobacteraceae bacterium]